MLITLDDLRRFAVARSLFKPTTLKRALDRLGFVQADPIRAPARAQDLILRHRVKDYYAGDLERLYPKLGIEEDFFVVYGFLTKSIRAVMHPRANAGVPADGSSPWPAAREKLARLLLEFVRKHGAVHPREVDSYFSHGTVKNYWGGSSNATTHLLAAMHYRGMDPRQGEQQDWGTLIFNFGRNEVRNFLIGNALFWLDKYHIDGLRVDAVASMLYLDYSREPGQWIPNVYGGRENLDAIYFLKRFNEVCYERFPGIMLRPRRAPLAAVPFWRTDKR